MPTTKMYSNSKESRQSPLAREDGYALFTIVLVVFIIGSLIIPPLLAFIGTGLSAGRNQEYKMYALYAADAGINQALTDLNDGLSDNETFPYYLPIFNLNNATVNVTIQNVISSTYKITSTATHVSGSEQTVVAIVKPMSFLDNALTSDGDISIGPGSYIEGDVWAGGDFKGDPNDINGDVLVGQDYIPWPTAQELYDEFMTTEVVNNPYSSDLFDVSTNSTITDTYRSGDLRIDNSGDGGLTLTLEGTLFVDVGTLNVAQSGSHDFTIDLNNQTIFVYNSLGPSNSVTFPSNVTLTGNGMIIARGDISFQPTTSGDGFVFVMSTDGTINMNPNGDFYGSLAGNVDLTLKPGATFTWYDPSDTGLDFPIASGSYHARYWNIHH